VAKKTCIELIKSGLLEFYLFLTLLGSCRHLIQYYVNGCRFDQCSISPLSLKGIKDAGYENMTVVQAATLPVIVKGLFAYFFKMV